MNCSKCRHRIPLGNVEVVSQNLIQTKPHTSYGVTTPSRTKAVTILKGECDKCGRAYVKRYYHNPKLSLLNMKGHPSKEFVEAIEAQQGRNLP